MSVDSEDDNKSKVSLRSQSQDKRRTVKKDLLVCLNYRDLQPTIVDREVGSRKKQEESFFSKIPLFCGLEGSNSEGCKCQPTCRWTEKWLTRIDRSVRQKLETSREWGSREWDETVKQVEKDLPRTQPDHPTFKNK